MLLPSRNWRQEIRIAVGICLLGLSLEYLQHLFYRNVMEWWDVRDDTIAVLVAVVLHRLGRGIFKITRRVRDSREERD